VKASSIKIVLIVSLVHIVLSLNSYGLGLSRLMTQPAVQKASKPVETKTVSIPKEIKERLLSVEDVKDGAELRAETIVAGANQTRLLIGGDGRFFCSPTGNCPYWIFRKTRMGYQEEVNLGEAQTVSIEKGKAKFPDVLARQHGSATDSDLRLYQFDGTRYRLIKCMNQSYRDPNDIDRILDKPIITEFQCEQ
jgi:hypothetical protein